MDVPGDVIPSKISKTQEGATLYDFTYVWSLIKSIEAENRMVMVRAWMREK